MGVVNHDLPFGYKVSGGWSATLTSDLVGRCSVPTLGTPEVTMVSIKYCVS